VNPIDVRDLLDHPGSSRTATVEAAIPGMRIELAAVPDDGPVHGQFLLESVVEGILVSGSVRGPLVLTCARCLRRFASTFDVPVQELCAAGAGPEDDEYPLDPQGDLDVEPMVRDAVILSLPFSPLCRTGCLGLCERCGGDRNAGECVCSDEVVDPRWAGLDRLQFN